MLQFEADFAKLHPNAVDRLKNTWELPTDHLVEKLCSLTIRNQSDLELLVQLNSENSGDYSKFISDKYYETLRSIVLIYYVIDLRAGILLSLLHYSVPPRRPGRKRKSQGDIVDDQPDTPRVLTIPERKESFFIHISVSFYFFLIFK